MIIKRIIGQISRRNNYIKWLKNRGLKIGEKCEVYPTANFGSEPFLISIGDNVRINQGVTFVTHDGGVWVLRHTDNELHDIDLFGTIDVGNNVHIGNNAIIMPGVSIGDNVIIGCGAIVTKSIPANSIAVGVPAKVIENINDYRKKHLDDFIHTKNLNSKEKKRILIEKYCK